MTSVVLNARNRSYLSPGLVGQRIFLGAGMGGGDNWSSRMAVGFQERLANHGEVRNGQYN